MTLDHEVIVAGAGPAGTAVAARLAQHGRGGRVLVLDRYRFPREKPCGGALTGHAEPVMAELGLAVTVPRAPCGDAVVRYGGFERRVAMGKTVDVIRRIDFDASLVAQVRARGVEVVEGEGVASYAVLPDAVEVTTTLGRRLRAGVLVGADGAASVVRKQLIGERAIPHRLFMHELATPAAAPATMIYDFTLMARGLRGYLWLFPAPGGRLNVGLMHYPTPEPGGTRGGRQLTGLLAEGLGDHDVALPARGSRGWPVWGYDPGAPVAAPRVVLVGDAAGIDGLTGEGIAVAMEQAVVAGDAVDRALATGRVDFRGYRRALRRAVVGRELALDRWLARLLYGGPRWREFLSLVLFDPDVLELYARRVDGTEILADQKLRLYRALLRHAVARRGRRGQLDAAERLLAAPPTVAALGA